MRLKEAKPVIFAALSGALLAAAFPKAGLWPLAWAGLAPLFYLAHQARPRAAFGLGFVFGLVHFVLLLYWITYVLSRYGGIPLVVGAFLMVLLCAYLALFFAAFSLLVSLVPPSAPRVLLGLPAAFVLLEWLRGRLLTGFPWTPLSHSQYARLNLIQICDIVGDWGVSFLVVAVNGGLFWALYKRREGMKSVLPLALALVFVGLALGYGTMRLKEVESAMDSGAGLNAALVQGNIPQDVKWAEPEKDKILDRYLALTRRAAESNPDIVVWPETSTPFFFGLDVERSKRVLEAAQELGVDILFGSPAAGDKNGGVVLYNRAYLFDRSGDYRGRYDKVHLVPFGEYVPLKRLLFFAKRLVQAAGDFRPGESLAPLQSTRARLGVLICYEVIFPELARAQTAEGAQVLVNITNDAWFGRTSAPYQHLTSAVFRAVENRRPLIRCANTGVSAIIDQRGRVHEASRIFETEIVKGEVAVTDMGSLYTHYPGGFIMLCAALALGLMGPPTIKELRRWRKTSR